MARKWSVFVFVVLVLALVAGFSLLRAGVEGIQVPSDQWGDVSDGGDTNLHFHSSDRARSNHTGTQARSTISDFSHAATHSNGSGDQINAANLNSGAATNGQVLTANGSGGLAFQTPAAGSVSGDVDTWVQKYLNNSGSSEDGTVSIRDTLSLKPAAGPATIELLGDTGFITMTFAPGTSQGLRTRTTSNPLGFSRHISCVNGAGNEIFFVGSDSNGTHGAHLPNSSRLVFGPDVAYTTLGSGGFTVQEGLNFDFTHGGASAALFRFNMFGGEFNEQAVVFRQYHTEFLRLTTGFSGGPGTPAIANYGTLNYGTILAADTDGIVIANNAATNRVTLTASGANEATINGSLLITGGYDHASRHSAAGADPINVANLGSGAAASGQVLTADGAGAVSFQTPSSGGITGTLATGEVPYATGTGTVDSDSQFAWSTTDKKLTVTNPNNVDGYDLDGATGILGQATGASGAGDRIGVKGRVQIGSGPQSNRHIGVLGQADASSGGGATTIGVFGLGSGAPTNRIGVYAALDGTASLATGKAALVADNGTIGNVLEAREYGSDRFRVLNGGKTDFHKNESLSFRLENRTTDISSPSDGNVYWKTDTDQVRVYDATAAAWATFNPTVAGSDQIANASTSKVVTLPRTMPDTSYHVSLTSVDASAGLPADIRVTTRTTTTFTISYTLTASTIDFTYSAVDY